MRRPASLVLAGSILLVATACGGSDSSEVDATAVSPTAVSATTEAPAGTDAIAPASTAAADTASPTTVSDTAAGGPLATPLELDPCLVGTWTVSLETISQLIAAAVLPVPDLTVPRGGFTVTLNDDGTVRGDADFTGAFTLGETPSEADVRWTGSGSWYTNDGGVTLSLDQQEGGLVEVRLGGEAQPGSALEADIPLAGGPYTCTDARLEVDGTAGDTTIPLIFER